MVSASIYQGKRPNEPFLEGKGRSVKIFYIAAGTVALALGLAGAVLPLLPATPFFLLAAACYARGSEKLHRRLMESRFPGRYLKSYLENRGVPVRVKVYTLALLWATLFLSMLSSGLPVWGRLLLAAVGIGVTFHVVSIKAGK